MGVLDQFIEEEEEDQQPGLLRETPQKVAADTPVTTGVLSQFIEAEEEPEDINEATAITALLVLLTSMRLRLVVTIVMCLLLLQMQLKHLI